MMFWIDHISEERCSVWYGPEWVQDFDSFDAAEDFIKEMKKNG